MTESNNNTHMDGGNDIEIMLAASAYGPLADYCTRDERVVVPCD